MYENYSQLLYTGGKIRFYLLFEIYLAKNSFLQSSLKMSFYNKLQI